MTNYRNGLKIPVLLQKPKRNRLGMDILREYFELNPHEELSAENAAAKLAISVTTARNYLGALAGEGLLERISIYKLKGDA